MEDNRILKERLSNWSTTNIVGAHAGMQHVVRRIKQVGNTNAPVLILGETGTGKDVVASALQEQSSRRDRAFVRLNCGAIPESLLDTELFGHEKGAFTGAHITHIGRIERADGGTLFLDEVGELSQSAQAKLLRVLQNGEIERIGGSSTRHVDVRVIAATHCDLEAMVADGRFRADLYYRLSVFPIIIPPLRERLSDIQLLTDSLIKKCSTNMNIAPPTLAPGAINVLLGYNWPGNVRELANVIERAMINNPEGPLTFPELNFGVQTNSDRTAPLPILDELVPLDEINRKYINYVLENVDGKIHGPGGAAEILEINPHTLRSRMDKLGISYRKQANSKSGTR
nr:sigma-54 dependent transcriptional regulator [Desulfovibrio sp. Huiquan2017]